MGCLRLASEDCFTHRAYYSDVLGNQTNGSSFRVDIAQRLSHLCLLFRGLSRYMSIRGSVICFVKRCLNNKFGSNKNVFAWLSVWVFFSETPFFKEDLTMSWCFQESQNGTP